MEMKKDRINEATSRSKSYIEYAQKIADSFNQDLNRKERIKAQLCFYCYYSPFLVGSAFTEYTCSVCGKKEMHPDTSTPQYCQDCALKNNICQKCGADINLKSRR